MRRLSVYVVACLLLLASGCSTLPAWTPRHTPACTASTGDLELDRERTYLAALLALNARQYAILHAEAPRQLEATFSSSTRWILTVQPDASLVIDTPENQRQTHKKTENWYAKLLQSTQLLQCRDLNWLRWEAQNRGLMSVGAGLGAAPGPVPSTQGGEVPATPAPASPALDSASAARLLELEHERASLHTGRSIAWAASGVGVAFGGFGLLYGALISHVTRTCESYESIYDPTDDTTDCPTTSTTRGLAIAGGTVLAAGGTMIGVALPRVFSKLRRSRELSREIKLLRDARFSPVPPAGTLGFTFSGRF